MITHSKPQVGDKVKLVRVLGNGEVGDIGLIVADDTDTKNDDWVLVRWGTGQYNGMVTRCPRNHLDFRDLASEEILISLARRQLAEAQQKLDLLVQEFCPGDKHTLIQYRDGKPPHCPHCKRDGQGNKY